MIELQEGEMQRIMDWLQKDLERRVSNAAESMKNDCPVDTGALRASLQAEGDDVKGLEYGLRVDKQHPWIQGAIDK